MTVQDRQPAWMWWACAGALAIAFALIVSSSNFPPVTDLPQHLAQIRLLDEQLGFAPKVARPDVYRINWIAPNNLIYVPMWLFARVLLPVATGKVTIWFLLCTWLAATFFLARRRRRGLPQALLAGVFLFNFVLYWGFLNFLIGMPLFLVWLSLVGPDEPLPRSAGKLIVLSVLALLLYEAHALWFAVAAAWMGASAIWSIARRRASAMSLALVALVLLPTIALATIWYPQLSRARMTGGFDTSAHWSHLPWTRLAPEYLSNALLGGLQGVFEPLLLLALLAWIGAALWTNRGALRERIDGRLLMASLLLWLIFFLAPEKYMNTISFAQRWAPVAALLLVLALPAPQGPRALSTLPAVMLAGLLAMTGWTWHVFNAETTGLQQSLVAVHSPCRLLWLSFGSSEFVKPSPFVQIGAYAQALHGCELNFTFAEHGSGVVTIEGRRQIRWTQGIEWLPELARTSDVQQFDTILIGGPDEVHAQMPSVLHVRPITTEGRFRLYAPN